MKLFDCHCHLQDQRILPDIENIMERAGSAGIEKLSCCGTSEANWNSVIEIAGRFPSVIPSFGLHPWHTADRSDEWLANLEKNLLSHPKAGLGEIGLDHGLAERNDDEQEEIFIQQLMLASKLERPLSIHCRRAWGRLVPILKEHGPFPSGFVVHAYSGATEILDDLFSLGGSISFSGSITRSGNKRGHKSAAAAPLDRLLIETDAPDMMPVIRDASIPDEDSPNEPANLIYTLKSIAALKNISVEAAAETTYRNACGLFIKS